MRVVFLYGPPGVGKLTVGAAISELTGIQLVHNHLSVNLVSAVFPFQSAPWRRLLRQIRRDVLTEAATQDLDLVLTGNYAGDPVGEEGWRLILEPVFARGGKVLSVQLTCDRDVLNTRVQNESRREHAKLMDPVVLSTIAGRFDLFASLPFEPVLKLDTTSLSPPEAAVRIAKHYDLLVDPTT
jgi:hypothetical protein